MRPAIVRDRDLAQAHAPICIMRLPLFPVYQCAHSPMKFSGNAQTALLSCGWEFALDKVYKTDCSNTMGSAVAVISPSYIHVYQCVVYISETIRKTEYWSRQFENEKCFSYGTISCTACRAVYITECTSCSDRHVFRSAHYGYTAKSSTCLTRSTDDFVRMSAPSA